MTRQYTAREMLDRLVAFPAALRDTNLPLVDFVRGYLSALGAENMLVANNAETKASIDPQMGSSVPSDLILSRHADVVAGEGQARTGDPFSLAERGGRQMKGRAATVRATASEVPKADLKRPIQIAHSYDEELGLLGVLDMMAEMRQTLPPASALAVGEPTMMKGITRHKGGLGLTTRMHGHSVHSSLLHTGISAVMEAAKLVNRHTERTTENRHIAEATEPDSPGAGFAPSYTTLHVSLIKGGTANNITTKVCWFNSEAHCLPRADHDAWLARHRAAAAEVEAGMQATRPEPGKGNAEALARAFTGDSSAHALSYGTKAGHVQAAGYSSCICGPGSIEQAHESYGFVGVHSLPPERTSSEA